MMAAGGRHEASLSSSRPAIIRTQGRIAQGAKWRLSTITPGLGLPETQTELSYR